MFLSFKRMRHLSKYVFFWTNKYLFNSPLRRIKKYFLYLTFFSSVYIIESELSSCVLAPNLFKLGKNLVKSQRCYKIYDKNDKKW